MRFLALLFVGVAALARAGAPSPPGWERMPDLPVANGGMACWTEGADVLVAGGTTWAGGVKRWLTGRWRWTAADNRWGAEPDLPSPVAYGVVVPASGGCLVLGGTDGQRTFRDVVRLERATHHPAGGLPDGLWLAGGAAIGNDVLILGGAADPADLATITAATGLWSPATGTYRGLPALPAGPTSLPAVVAAGGRAYAFTGGYWDAASRTVANRRSAQVLDVGRGTWSARRDFPHEVRGLAAAWVGPGLVYLAGGYRNDRAGFTAEAFLYDVESDAYRPAPPLPVAAMVHLLTVGDDLWVLGGEDRQKHRSAGCWRVRRAALAQAASSKGP